MKPILAILTILSTGSTASAIDAKPYVALRKQYGVRQSTSLAALETFMGDKVLELRGSVKGSFRVGDRNALMLDRPNGDAVMMNAPQVPAWLVGNESPARFLVRAKRMREYDELEITLISAVPESDVARFDPVAKPSAPASNSRSARSGGLQLSGPIGRQPARTNASRGTKWSLPASEVTPIYAAFIKSRNRKLSNNEALRIAQGIVGFSLRYGVDARLIMAMVMVESGFDPGARSAAGAMGLGQLMPGTAEWMGVNNPYDSVENLYGTVKLMRTHLNDYKRKTGEDFQALILSLAAYNAGMGAVRRHGGVPPYRETQNYVRKVVGLYYAFLGRA